MEKPQLARLTQPVLWKKLGSISPNAPKKHPEKSHLRTIFREASKFERGDEVTGGGLLRLAWESELGLGLRVQTLTPYSPQDRNAYTLPKPRGGLAPS